MDRSSIFPPGSALTAALLNDLATEAGTLRALAHGLGPWDLLAQTRGAVPPRPAIFHAPERAQAPVARPVTADVLAALPWAGRSVPSAPDPHEHLTHTLWGWSLLVARTDAAMQVWIRPVSQAMRTRLDPNASLERLWQRHPALDLDVAIRSNNPEVLRRWWGAAGAVVRAVRPSASLNERLGAPGVWRREVEQVFEQLGPTAVWAAHVMPMIDEGWPQGLGMARSSS